MSQFQDTLAATETSDKRSSTEEFFERAGTDSDPMIHILAFSVLARALSHHHGKRQDDLYSQYPLNKSPEVRGHWRAAAILKKAQHKAISEYKRVDELRTKARKREHDRAKASAHRRAVAANTAVTRVLQKAKIGVRCEDDQLVIKPGNREYAFYLVEA